jgi:WD40 repeat protein
MDYYVNASILSKVVGVTHNHKLCYFESFDGASIRELPASESDPIHSVDVSLDGLYIVTGGADRQVKVCFLSTSQSPSSKSYIWIKACL